MTTAQGILLAMITFFFMMGISLTFWQLVEYGQEGMTMEPVVPLLAALITASVNFLVSVADSHATRRRVYA